MVSGSPARAAGPELMYASQANRQDDIWTVDIWTVDITSGAVRRITNHPARDCHGVVSPDGRRLVFNSERVGWWKVWIADADGSHPVQLTSPASGADYYPDWSPDGHWIAFASDRGGTWAIYVMDAEGAVREAALSDVGQGEAIEPSWYPDSSRLIYQTDGGSHIFLMPAAGGEARRLTATEHNYGPRWVRP